MKNGITLNKQPVCISIVRHICMQSLVLIFIFDPVLVKLKNGLRPAAYGEGAHCHGFIETLRGKPALFTNLYPIQTCNIQ